MVCDPASAGLGPIIDALLIDRKQHGFNDNQALADAVCFCLTQKHAMALENALGDKTTLSEASVIVQNTGVDTREAIRENRDRSEERRVGKEGVRTCRSRWSRQQ